MPSDITHVLQFCLHPRAGEDESLRAAVAGCLGWYVRHCLSEEVESLLESVLGFKLPSKWARLGNALTLAAIAEHAAAR